VRWVHLGLQAQGVVIPGLAAVSVAAVVNVGLNRVLIWGVGSWGGLGFQGSPIATSLSCLLLLSLLLG
jgi:Na+-driven multidrug efflux pump